MNHLVKEKQIVAPQQLKNQYVLTQALEKQIHHQRIQIKNILNGEDSRLLVITGPCSLHDSVAALDYAQRLKKLQDDVADEMLIVMRAYIEKPRTTVGWKGLLYDPQLDGDCDLEQGLCRSRDLYLKLVQTGLPIAGEILNPMAMSYLDDLLAWGAIGARTSESQIHREIASSVCFPIGFKNGTDGSVQIAVDAILSAQASHEFFALGQVGLPVHKSSDGNPKAHLILRGANSGSNYDVHSIRNIQQKLKDKMPSLVIDCSHGNSGKDPLKQPEILKQIIEERHLTHVKGIMLESHLEDGAQKISKDMLYGQSVTDGCLGWEKTYTLLKEVSKNLKKAMV